MRGVRPGRSRGARATALLGIGLALTMSACSSVAQPIVTGSGPGLQRSPDGFTFSPEEVDADDSPHIRAADSETYPSFFPHLTPYSSTVPLRSSAPAIAGALPARTSCDQHLPVGWVAMENRNAGSSRWTLPKKDKATTATVVGFARTTTTACGETLKLAVSSSRPWRAQLWRIGFYHGTGGRLMYSSTVQPADEQSPPAPFGTSTGEGGSVDWHDSLEIPITPAMTPGVYLVKFVPKSGVGSYYPIVVRGAVGTVMFPLSTYTYQAYNIWGGKSSYSGVDADGKLVSSLRQPSMSFDRPYWGDSQYQYGDGLLLRHDHSLLWWLEKNGVDVAYTTDDFLNQHLDLLAKERVLVLGAHAEYATRSYVEAVRQQVKLGLNLLSTGTNAMYWRVAPMPGPHRIVLNSKQINDPGLPVTRRFRDEPDPLPEAGLLGGQYNCFGMLPLTGHVLGASLFPWSAANIRTGASLVGVGGGETDQIYPGVSNPAAQVLMHVPFTCTVHANARVAWDMTYSAVKDQGGVFSAGTEYFTCALASSCGDLVPADSQRTVRALFAVLARTAQVGPLGTWHPSVPNVRLYNLPAPPIR